jgi:hypothetical protein
VLLTGELQLKPPSEDQLCSAVPVLVRNVWRCMSGNESLALYRAIAFSIIHVVLSFGTFTWVYVFPCSETTEQNFRLYAGRTAGVPGLPPYALDQGLTCKEAGLHQLLTWPVLKQEKLDGTYKASCLAPSGGEESSRILQEACKAL